MNYQTISHNPTVLWGESPKPVFIITIVMVCLLATGAALGQTTTFTYQGRFTDGGTAANGTYDMQFKLFDGPTPGSGNQIGSTITNNPVAISSGVFTVQLDFGNAGFSGADRFLEIGVRPSGSSDPYTVLAPRQQLTSAVYAIRAGSTVSADNASQLGGVAANQYVQANDSRLTDARTPSAGSSSYIQNSTSQQTANFNISGDGSAAGTLSAKTVNATTQYNIGGSRVLSAGPGNTSVGINAGVIGSAQNNSFFGSSAGAANDFGFENSFFGSQAGHDNSSGTYNSFFGGRAGSENSTGASNAFFGHSAGFGNAKGSRNSFFGVQAGFYNGDGTDNSAFGIAADVSTNLNNASAIGAHASATQSNSLVLGSINGVNDATADTSVGIGTTAPKAKFHLSGTGIVRARINSDSRAILNSPPARWRLLPVKPERPCRCSFADGVLRLSAARSEYRARHRSEWLQLLAHEAQSIRRQLPRC